MSGPSASTRVRLLSLLVVLGVPSTVVWSQDADGGAKLAIHGYLSQAYAFSDPYQVLGIPKDGTADYRTAALQFRATMSDKDAFVIQFSQERLGQSPVMKTKSEVDLDWIFYERRITDSLSVRAGKVKIPFGIYNEVRFVGPALPLFRAADVFYGEGSFTFETVNGAVLSSKLFAGHRFSLDVDLYGGEWSFLQEDNATRARAQGVGGQIWLKTPLQGLRVGFAGHRSTASNVLGAPEGAKQNRNKWAASLDGNFARFRVNVEFEEDSFGSGDFEAGYALASFRLSDKLSLTAQFSRSHLELGPPVGLATELGRDYAVGLSYACQRHLLLKAEHHWASGHTFETPDAGLFKPSLATQYTILSLATHF